MKFGITCEVSADVYTKVAYINEVEALLKNKFIEKDYGAGVDKILMGVICVWKRADDFFKQRNKYDKIRKILSLDVKLDHERVQTADALEIKCHIADVLINAMSVIREMKIKDFNVDAFEKDMRGCLENVR